MKEKKKKEGKKGAGKELKLFKVRRDAQVFFPNLLYHKRDWVGNPSTDNSKAQPTTTFLKKVTWSVYQPFNSNLILLRNGFVPSNRSLISFSVTSFPVWFLPGKGEKDQRDTVEKGHCSSCSSVLLGRVREAEEEVSWESTSSPLLEETELLTGLPREPCKNTPAYT